MEGEDLTVMFEGADPPERDHWTTAYSANVAAGDGRLRPSIADNQGKERRLEIDTESDPDEEKDVASDNPDVVDRLWQYVLDDAGGTMPVFGKDPRRHGLGQKLKFVVPFDGCERPSANLPVTSCSAVTPSPRATRTKNQGPGPTACSSREISVGCRPAFAESCSCVSLAAFRCRRRFAANRSSGAGLTAAILRQV